MEEESTMSHQQSLQLINEMIGKAKKSYVTTGIASMVWGAIIFFCSMYTWAEVHFKFDGGDPWILTLVAVIIQIIVGVIESKKKNFISYEGEVLKYVWTAFGISIFIASIYSGKFPSNGEVTSIFMLLYALPTFITGGVTKFKPMIFGGIFCWIASIISIFTVFEIDNLLMAACGLFAWLIPGIILWGKYKKNKVANV
jgi:hypothetical protein